MRFTIRNSLRATGIFRLVEALESRVLLASYTLTHLTSMTGGKVGGTGSTPQGLVMAPNGDLYGTTSVGGPKGYGTVFKIAGTANAHATRLLHRDQRNDAARGAGGRFRRKPLGNRHRRRGFRSRRDLGDCRRRPCGHREQYIDYQRDHGGVDVCRGERELSDVGLFADTAGNFYGYTVGTNASPNKDKAVVFKLVPAAGTNSVLTSLAAFTFKNGNYPLPQGGLTIDSGGNIFGVTRNGGNKQLGTVFEIAASSSTITTLVTFNGTNGSAPNSELLIDGGGAIYGTTMFGGTNGGGTIFKIQPAGTSSTLTVLKSFNGTNGSRPVGNLFMDGGGSIFGVTITGGANGPGTLFRWTPVGTTSTITTLFSFKGQNTGTNPSGPLVMDANGHFFGTTSTGGTKNIGAVFDLAPP